MPLPQLETRHVDEHSGSLRWRFATKNFRIAFLQVFVQGRPFYNTIIYVALTLLFALTIQPLAAYALSRFNPPGMWKIIFIFMATMAFPPMVGTLPTFLIMKKLNSPLAKHHSHWVLPFTRQPVSSALSTAESSPSCWIVSYQG